MLENFSEIYKQNIYTNHSFITLHFCDQNVAKLVLSKMVPCTLERRSLPKSHPRLEPLHSAYKILNQTEGNLKIPLGVVFRKV